MVASVGRLLFAVLPLRAPNRDTRTGDQYEIGLLAAKAIRPISRLVRPTAALQQRGKKVPQRDGRSSSHAGSRRCGTTPAGDAETRARAAERTREWRRAKQRPRPADPLNGRDRPQAQ